MRIKICGITRPEDARAAEAAGADAIGLIFADGSSRRLGLLEAEAVCAAVGPFTATIGVFVDAPLPYVRKIARRLRLSAVQLHGREDASYAGQLRRELPVIKAFRFDELLSLDDLRVYPADAVLLDGPAAGSGRRFDWQQAQFLRGFPRLVLAGGLTPGNVAEGIRALAPYGVDVSSGVEGAPGRKDADLIAEFVRAARSVKLSTPALGYPQDCGKVAAGRAGRKSLT